MMRWFRIVVFAVLAALIAAGCSGGDGDEAALDESADAVVEAPVEEESSTLDTDPGILQPAVAETMGAVTSVRFELERTGAPVFIDQAGLLSLNNLLGTFEVPGSANAILQVTVSESLNTELGAIAVADEVWLTNPITGEFETLPPGFDIDPSLFFDPVNGWQPLIEDLSGTTFVGEEEREGQDSFHITGTAPADRMQAVTAGLVRGQDVDIDLWVNPETGEVIELAFSTVFDGAQSDWRVLLSEYGEDFDISAPDVDG